LKYFDYNGMFRAIFLQVVVVAVAAVFCALAVGVHGGISAALGGGVYIFPNLFFALRLNSKAIRHSKSFATDFLFGEVVKLTVFAGSLYVIVVAYADVHWLSLMIGLALATQAMFFAFWKMNETWRR
jgi:F0F1-type ATP synthase assembly protein I